MTDNNEKSLSTLFKLLGEQEENLSEEIRRIRAARLELHPDTTTSNSNLFLMGIDLWVDDMCILNRVHDRQERVRIRVDVKNLIDKHGLEITMKQIYDKFNEIRLEHKNRKEVRGQP